MTEKSRCLILGAGMGTPAEALLDCVQKLILRAVMQFVRFPEEVIDRVDAQLRKIPNP